MSDLTVDPEQIAAYSKALNNEFEVSVSAMQSARADAAVSATPGSLSAVVAGASQERWQHELQTTQAALDSHVDKLRDSAAAYTAMETNAQAIAKRALGDR